MATLLDIENLDSKKRFLINLLHYLYKNGQLIIPENLIRAVVIIEAYISDSNFFYEKIPKETEVDASFFERFTKSNICFCKLNTLIKHHLLDMYISWGQIEPRDIKNIQQNSHILIKRCLKLNKYRLKTKFKETLLRAYKMKSTNGGEIVFNENSLIQAFYQSPKPIRIIFSFLISFLAR